MLKIALGSAAQKFLNKAEKQLYGRLRGKIKELAIDTFPHGCKRVVNRKEKTFRIRVGDYRILYAVFYEKNEVYISEIEKRPKAYD